MLIVNFKNAGLRRRRHLVCTLFNTKMSENTMIKTKHIGAMNATNAFEQAFRTNLSSEFGIKIAASTQDKYMVYAVNLNTGDAWGDVEHCSSLRYVRYNSGRIVTQGILTALKVSKR